MPFARIAQHDEQRTHADIRELAWFKAGEGYEWRAGIRKVFWGVTESQHLVDIINQTDLVENIDGEEKLGQPMINLALIRSWGTLDLYILTGSRERTFPGREGRLRTALPVDTGKPFTNRTADADASTTPRVGTNRSAVGKSGSPISRAPRASRAWCWASEAMEHRPSLLITTSSTKAVSMYK